MRIASSSILGTKARPVDLLGFFTRLVGPGDVSSIPENVTSKIAGGLHFTREYSLNWL